LKSDWFNPILRAATAGSVRQNLTYNLLETLEIPLPPLEEQRAIVARWQAAQAEQDTFTVQIGQMEDSIPAIVYEALGTPSPKPRTAKSKCVILEWAEMDRWSFRYLAQMQQGQLGFTQSYYPIVELGTVLEDTRNGYCIKPVTGPTPYKMLKLSALTPAGLNLDETKYVPVSDKIANVFSLRKDDLLICRSNAYEYVGKCAVVEHDDPNVLFSDIIIRMRLKEEIASEYVREVIETPLGRSFFQVNSRRAVGGMWKISAQDIRSFPLPLPPLDVQRGIVARVQERRAEIARLREQAAQRARESAAEIEATLIGTKTQKT